MILNYYRYTLAVKRTRWIIIIGPGMLIAATGVGAGDLAAAGIAGSKFGTVILWAVLVGAFFKFMLTEGLTRWQLATGSTLLEGAIQHFGWSVRIVFGMYFLFWSFVTAAALMSASGVTMQAMVPLLENDLHGKVLYGALHSLIGVAVAWFGGFRVFERCMSICIGIMFVTVIVTAILLEPDLKNIARGLVIPRIPDLSGDGLTWTIGLLGGVGGTVTILCYGYWIREAGRTTMADMTTCRLDLAAGYVMTALFGIAMIIIADGIDVSGKGVGLIVALADQLGQAIGPGGRWVFLFGAWAAVFSSLLGVWQAVPYLFADLWRLTARRDQRTSGSAVDTKSAPYRIFLLALAILPLVQVRYTFEDVQRSYVVTGALFIPILAVALLIMNGRSAWVGPRHRNSRLTTSLLIVVLLFFIWAGYMKLTL